MRDLLFFFHDHHGNDDHLTHGRDGARWSVGHDGDAAQCYEQA
jgi:hypothetical protein